MDGQTPHFAVSVQRKMLAGGAARYRVTWRPSGAGGPQRVVTFADYDQAEVYASLVRVLQREPGPVEMIMVGLAAPQQPDSTDRRPGPGVPDTAEPVGPTLIEACHAYLRTLHGVVLPETLYGYQVLLRNHLVPYFGVDAA